MLKIKDCKLEVFKFPAGEVHFKLLYEGWSLEGPLVITTDLRNSDELMLLMLISDRYKNIEKHLELLYTPYARQDRITSDCEPFSLRAFANMINSCGFKIVTIYDPHSDVTPALINNASIVHRLDTACNIKPLKELLQSPNTVIVSPDGGAMKTNNKIARHFKLPHICATKVRDTQTGEITATRIHAAATDITDRDLVILDDICDGGKTFIEIAKALENQKPRSLSLYTTVGIYSKGKEVLEPYFSNIFCYHQLGE